MSETPQLINEKSKQFIISFPKFREDLAAWYSDLFNIPSTEQTFLEDIETGVLLCKFSLMVRTGSMDYHCLRRTRAWRRRGVWDVTFRNLLTVIYFLGEEIYVYMYTYNLSLGETDATCMQYCFVTSTLCFKFVCAVYLICALSDSI